MDPIVLAVIAAVVLILLLRIFFGVAKFGIKLILAIVLAIVIWRLVAGG
jgi:hypothetical protein